MHELFLNVCVSGLGSGSGLRILIILLVYLNMDEFVNNIDNILQSSSRFCLGFAYTPLFTNIFGIFPRLGLHESP